MRFIKATANKQKRTFTLRTYRDGKLEFKYRTLPFTRGEFSCMWYYNTQRDWEYFLNHTGDYYRVYNSRTGK